MANEEIFSAYLQVCEQATDLVSAIYDLSTNQEKLDAIEYAIQLLSELKSELNG